ncbi:maltose ABC transporter substrate-binding protein [Staphylococcus delphini]|uniref:Maltodextrin-binding protein n=1 Tax=Staphylococcus delphini TaxID=53344 RepID=A0A2A4GZF5_9STAP|nr:extracellular solute-binding protein [Staphylococcus delphini]PCF56737.1 maltose ABC transporter substrate-binding protein [Staphylococcus delphini]PCF62905.1 maltose ABC transporter substrate-binding protein [Staphylococcus delphini]PCF72607.1 maltose ABC transporter substrate-binding protein [Staphylococcus delphini]HEC2157826.1 extracellular solute-binding protein [Staphylococcus delphini]
MNKMLKAALLLITVLVVLTACGPNRSQKDIEAALNRDNTKEKPEQLTMWVDGDAQMAFYKKITAAYTKKTGIPVRLVNVAQNDQLENLSLDAPAGKGPDLFFLAHDNTGSAYLQGLAAELDFTDEQLKGFNKQALLALNYDNKQLALPSIVESTALLYNKKYVKTAPKTIQEVEANADRINKPADHQYGFLFDGRDPYFNYPFMFNSNNYVFKKHGDQYDVHQTGINDPQVIKNGKRLQKWYEKGYLPKAANHNIMIGLFKDGQVGQFVTGPWNLTEFQQTLGDDLGVTTLPSDNGMKMRPYLGVRGWYLSEYSQSKYWAKDLMLYLTSRDTLQKYTDERNEITGRLDVKSSNPNLKAFEEQAKNAEPMPNIPEMRQVWTPMANASTFISEGQDPKQALEDANRDIQQNIKILQPNDNE